MLQDVSIPNLVDDGSCYPERAIGPSWKGGTWERPTYENAEGLVARLAREHLIGHEPLVDDALQAVPAGVAAHAARRFSRATGLSRRAVRQIEQARRAAVRLREGATPTEVTHELGYYDQPHLTRSMQRYLGGTLAQLAHPRRDSTCHFCTNRHSRHLRDHHRLRAPIEAARRWQRRALG